MKQENKGLESTKTQQNPQINPRKAATKLKQVRNNMQMMRNRFKVLESQDQYNRYRTLDQQKRIQQHNMLHQQIKKNKQQLKKSLLNLDHTSQLKEKSQKLKLQIRQRIKQARQTMQDQKSQRYQTINQQSLQHEHKIKKNKNAQIGLNRSKKQELIQQEQKKRQYLKKFYQTKIKTTLLEKSKDSSSLQKQINNVSKLLESYSQVQKKLLQKSNQSLQSSQIMKSRYYDVITQKNGSYKLPEIRTKSTNSKTSSNSQLIVLGA